MIEVGPLVQCLRGNPAPSQPAAAPDGPAGSKSAAFDAADARHMETALELAWRAGELGEVPVGAVVVLEGRVVGRGHNAPIARNDPTAHAEIAALRDAGRTVGNYRLTGATLYCTVEPCLMCTGAALHARIGRLVFAAADPKVGAASRLERLREAGASLNHRFETVGGLLAGRSSRMLQDFFRRQREADRSTGEWTRDGEVPKWS